jgi:pimeloyl-ACP methyl ester carboxylesterase
MTHGCRVSDRSMPMSLIRDTLGAALRAVVLAVLLTPALGRASVAWAQPVPTSDGDGFWRAKDGVRVHYIASGTPTGPAVVLVHGFLGEARTWEATPLIGHLRAAGYRVIAIDLRGNGASDHPTTLAAYTHDAEARDIMGVTRRLGLAEYCAIGYSRGSIITARLLVLDRRVGCAVLGGMGADFTNPAWPRRIAAYRLLAGLPQDSAAAAPVAGMLRAAEQRKLDRRVLALQQQAQPSTSRAELGRVRQPVLVIAGDQDHDDGDAAELARLMAHATHVVVPGDHGSVFRSSAFADSVLSFLGRVASAKR